jgi:hypothetical protein
MKILSTSLKTNTEENYSSKGKKICTKLKNVCLLNFYSMFLIKKTNNSFIVILTSFPYCLPKICYVNVARMMSHNNGIVFRNRIIQSEY